MLQSLLFQQSHKRSEQSNAKIFLIRRNLALSSQLHFSDRLPVKKRDRFCAAISKFKQIESDRTTII
jgi:hypothetical protein